MTELSVSHHITPHLDFTCGTHSHVPPSQHVYFSDPIITTHTAQPMTHPPTQSEPSPNPPAVPRSCLRYCSEIPWSSRLSDTGQGSDAAESRVGESVPVLPCASGGGAWPSRSDPHAKGSSLASKGKGRRDATTSACPFPAARPPTRKPCAQREVCSHHIATPSSSTPAHRVPSASPFAPGWK